MSVGRLKRMLDCLPTGCVDVDDEKEVAMRSHDSRTRLENCDGDVRQYVNDYSKFNTLIELDESTQSTIDDNTENSAVSVPMSPTLVVFNQFIEREQIGDRVKWGRMVMQFIFSIGNNAEQPGKLTFGFKREAIFLASAEQLRNPYLLSAQVLAHDTESMPVDIIFSFKTGAGSAAGADSEKSATSIFNQDDRAAPLDHTSSYTNGAILLRNGTRAVYQLPPTIFGNVLIFEDPLRRVRFSSIEAVNFNSDDFLHRIARRVDRTDETSVARLFCLSNQQRLTQRTVTACSRHGVHRHCFYMVSLEYMFTSLLRRVHDYLMICQAQIDYMNSTPLDGFDLDTSLYKLPVTSTDVVFECDALSRVLQFINSHLINAHPPFVPEKICANIRPFASQRREKVENNWTSVWNEHVSNNSGSNGAVSATTEKTDEKPENDGVDGAPERNLECCVTCVFNFVSLPEHITSPGASSAQPVIPVKAERPRRRPPVMSKRNDSTTDDENGAAGVTNGDNESSSCSDIGSPLPARTRHSVPSSMPALARRSGKHESNNNDDTPPDSVTDPAKLYTNGSRTNARATANGGGGGDDNDDDDDDGPNGYDFSFGRYLTTPLRHTMPPAASLSMLEEQQHTTNGVSPLLLATAPAGVCGAADGQQSNRTPRTESPSDQQHAVQKLLQSVTTDSRDDSESDDDDDNDGDGEEDEEDDADESSFDLAPVPDVQPTPRPVVGVFGAPIPTSNTPYNAPIMYHIQSPLSTLGSATLVLPPPPLHHHHPPPPLPPSVAVIKKSATKSTYTSVESRSTGSGDQTTQFRLSTSSSTQSNGVDGGGASR